MERSIRIGKDFNVRWSIHRVVDGERQPYELAGKELVLRYRTPYGLKEATEWKTEGNTIVWTFRGKEQKALGSYELILTENGGKDGMVTVDTCRAFKLVAHSCEETEGSGGDIVAQTIMLETEVAFAPIIIRGGGEGGSYDDSELRGMIAEQGERIDELADEVQDLKESGLGYDDTELRQQVSALADEVGSNGVLIEDLQNTKIDKENDDYYPNMAVGLADNLVGVDVVDSEINFRRSGGGAISDGVARVQSIKGNSVVWNQKIQNSQFSTKEHWLTYEGVLGEKGLFTLRSLRQNLSNAFVGQNMSIIAGHVYYVTVSIKPGVATSFRSLFAGGQTVIPVSQIAGGQVHVFSKILKATSESTAIYMYPNTKGEMAEGDTCEYLELKVVDLTEMFGAGNEPTTIEDFNARIPQGVDLNAYNEGEVIHMDVQSIESQGVNAWDEQWENGTFNTSTGVNIDTEGSKKQIRSKNIIAVLPNKDYYVAQPSSLGDDGMWVMLYDEKMQIIEGYAGSGSISGNSFKVAYNLPTFKTAPNARYMRFYLPIGYGATYKGDICINLSDTAVNGKYFPYEEASEDFGFVAKYFPNGMRSAGTAHDEIRYNKATNRWEAVKRIGEVDLGNFTWALAVSTGEFRAQTPVQGIVGGTVNILCKQFIATTADKVYGDVEGIAIQASGAVWVRDSAYPDATSFKAAMAGVMLYYELAEPIVTELDEADQFKDLDYQVWNCGTEKAIAEGKSAPLSADITYGFNAPAKIKENADKIKENANEIAKLKQSSGSTATYKTINGTSVVGSGNIDTHYPISSSTVSALTIQPNTYYKWSGATLNVTLGSTDANLCEFVIELSVTGTPSITFPSSVKWVNGIAPTFVSGKTYIVSIVNNLGVYAAF